MREFTLPNDDAQLLQRVLEPGKPLLSPAAAESILQLQFPKEDQTRMKRLAERARAGTLTAGEANEIGAYDRVGSLIAILQSKARKTLSAGPAKPAKT
ncbi:MAG TPA: hypothetical protein VGJ05_05085 [Fimbriiglobus sp.]|jgi:hypothetical protein